VTVGDVIPWILLALTPVFATSMLLLWVFVKELLRVFEDDAP